MLLKVALFLCVLHRATPMDAECNDGTMGGLCGDPCGTGLWITNATGNQFCCPFCEDSVGPVEYVKKAKSGGNLVTFSKTELSEMLSTPALRTSESLVTDFTTTTTVKSRRVIKEEFSPPSDAASKADPTGALDSTVSSTVVVWVVRGVFLLIALLVVIAARYGHVLRTNARSVNTEDQEAAGGADSDVGSNANVGTASISGAIAANIVGDGININIGAIAGCADVKESDGVGADPSVDSDVDTGSNTGVENAGGGVETRAAGGGDNSM